jgi:hypothetical protein
VIVLLAIGVNTALTLSNIARVRHDEARTRSEAVHVRVVQQAGAPVAVCLLEALRAVTPLLLRVPSVEAPLAAYVRLQSHRYPGVSCPDRTPEPSEVKP